MSISVRTRRRTLGLVLAASAITMPLVAGAASNSRPPQDVPAFFDSVPGWVHDEDAECTDTHTGVAYVDNRVLVSGAEQPGVVRQAVHDAVRAQYGPLPGGASWVEGIEEIEFPSVAGAGTSRRLYQVDLVPRGEGHDLLDLSRKLMATTPSFDVSPDHGLVPAGPINSFWPNGYPRVAPGLDPARDVPTQQGDAAGTGVKIAIYDTGLAAPADLKDLPSVERMRLFDIDVADPDGDGVAYSLVAGHALAMSGTIQTVVPGAEVQVGRIANEGIATDTTTVKRIAASLTTTNQSEWPHVIVLAFGSPACLADPADVTAGYLVPVGLQHAIDVIEQLADERDGGMVVVASAGNRGESRPYYPAAFDNVVGVGALDLSLDADGSPWTSATATGTIAPFSNRGNWVSAWAPGVSLPTTHLDGLRLDANPKGPLLEGYAYVDGTSFSAPVLAAMIADHASRTDTGEILDVRCAWAELEAAGASPTAANGRPLPGASIVFEAWTTVPDAKTPGVPAPFC